MEVDYESPELLGLMFRVRSSTYPENNMRTAWPRIVASNDSRGRWWYCALVAETRAASEDSVRRHPGIYYRLIWRPLKFKMEDSKRELW